MSTRDEHARWRDRVALVTGASSGIGRAIAQALHDLGMRVAVTARRREPLEELARHEPCDRWLLHTADARRIDELQSLFECIRTTWGGVDVLVNNAGLGFRAPLLEGDEEAWRTMLEVNVLALSYCTREATKDMRARGDDGYVFHVSSMASHRVPPGGGMYSATKFAVRALTEGLRQELRAAGSGVRVTAISPGLVETGFAENFYGCAETAQTVYARFKTLEPRDIADLVVYALGTPQHVQLHDLLLRPTRQET